MTRPLLAAAVLALAGCEASTTAADRAPAPPYRSAVQQCSDACRSSGKRMKSHKDAFFTQGVCECEAQP